MHSIARLLLLCLWVAAFCGLLMRPSLARAAETFELEVAVCAGGEPIHAGTEIGYRASIQQKLADDLGIAFHEISPEAFELRDPAGQPIEATLA